MTDVGREVLQRVFHVVARPQPVLRYDIASAVTRNVR